MDTLQILYFLKVAETEHMTNAAKELHISQPALSRSLRMLEEDLGVKLFDRVGRRLVLNENGRRFHAAALQFERDIHTLRTVPQTNHEVTGSLTVRIHIDNLSVMQAVADFCRCYPGVQVKAVSTGGREGDDGHWDFLLDAFNPLFSQMTEQLESLFEEPYMLAVSEDLPLFDSSVVSLAEARELPFVLPTCEQELTGMILAYCRTAGFRPRCRMETNDYLIMLSMVAGGGCVALVPQFAPAVSNYPHVKLLSLREQAFRRTIVLQESAGEKTAAREAFRKHIVQSLRKNF